MVGASFNEALGGLMRAGSAWLRVHGPDFATDEEKALAGAMSEMAGAMMEAVLVSPSVPDEEKMQLVMSVLSAKRVQGDGVPR
jgi:hypothetical protein